MYKPVRYEFDLYPEMVVSVGTGAQNTSSRSNKLNPNGEIKEIVSKGNKPNKIRNNKKLSNNWVCGSVRCLKYKGP